MDIYTLNRAKTIQEELKDLNYEKVFGRKLRVSVLEQKYGVIIIGM